MPHNGAPPFAKLNHVKADGWAQAARRRRQSQCLSDREGAGDLGSRDGAECASRAGLVPEPKS